MSTARDHVARRRAETAEARCDHQEKWVSVTGDGSRDACWSCLLDAYFEDVLGPEGSDG